MSSKRRPQRLSAIADTTSQRDIDPHVLMNSTNPTHSIHGRRVHRTTYATSPPVGNKSTSAKVEAVVRARQVASRDMQRKIYTPILNDIARSVKYNALTASDIDIKLYDWLRTYETVHPDIEIMKRESTQRKIKGALDAGRIQSFAITHEHIDADGIISEDKQLFDIDELNELFAGNTIKEMHKGGMVNKTKIYKLQKGEMIVPKNKVKAVKSAMKKAKLKAIS